MFGKLLGKVLAAPVRLVNIPIVVTEKLTGARVDVGLVQATAETIEEGVAEAVDGEDGS